MGFKGYAFLLNERGELIDQEKADMFIPEAGGDIRSKMIAGDTGVEYDVDSANYVAYAPIRSIHSPDGKSFWSVGISMPERGDYRACRRDPQQVGLGAGSGPGHLRGHDRRGGLRRHEDLERDHRAHQWRLTRA